MLTFQWVGAQFSLSDVCTVDKVNRHTPPSPLIVCIRYQQQRYIDINSCLVVSVQERAKSTHHPLAAKLYYILPTVQDWLHQRAMTCITCRWLMCFVRILIEYFNIFRKQTVCWLYQRVVTCIMCRSLTNRSPKWLETTTYNLGHSNLSTCLTCSGGRKWAILE